MAEWNEQVAQSKKALHIWLNTGGELDREDIEVILRAAHKAQAECDRAHEKLSSYLRDTQAPNGVPLTALDRRIAFLAAENATLAMRIRNRNRAAKKGRRPGAIWVVASIVHCDCGKDLLP